MAFRPGIPELILVLVIVIILFGVGRVSKIGGELGSAIREFRKGLGNTEHKPAEGEAKQEEKPEQK